MNTLDSPGIKSSFRRKVPRDRPPHRPSRPAPAAPAASQTPAFSVQRGAANVRCDSPLPPGHRVAEFKSRCRALLDADWCRVHWRPLLAAAAAVDVVVSVLVALLVRPAPDESWWMMDKLGKQVLHGNFNLHDVSAPAPAGMVYFASLFHLCNKLSPVVTRVLLALLGTTAQWLVAGATARSATAHPLTTVALGAAVAAVRAVAALHPSPATAVVLAWALALRLSTGRFACLPALATGLLGTFDPYLGFAFSFGAAGTTLHRLGVVRTVVLFGVGSLGLHTLLALPMLVSNGLIGYLGAAFNDARGVVGWPLPRVLATSQTIQITSFVVLCVLLLLVLLLRWTLSTPTLLTGAGAGRPVKAAYIIQTCAIASHIGVLMAPMVSPARLAVAVLSAPIVVSQRAEAAVPAVALLLLAPLIVVAAPCADRLGFIRDIFWAVHTFIMAAAVVLAPRARPLADVGAGAGLMSPGYGVSEKMAGSEMRVKRGLIRKHHID